MREIDLSKFQIRTDLIDETDTIDVKEEYEKDSISVKKYHVDEQHASTYQKEVGDYTTITFSDITDTTNYEKVKQILMDELAPYLTNKSKILLIGLGNSRSTPDALGPLTIEDVLVTSYLKEFGPLEEGFRETISFVPGVTGTSGIETSTFVKSVTDLVKPDLVILIDALASKSLDRLCKTIQLSTAGISPGSGIGNHREVINEEVLQTSVLVIGVPTVVDAVSIVSDTMHFLEKKYAFEKNFLKQKKSLLLPSSQINYLKGKQDPINRKELLGLVGTLQEGEIKQLFYEVLTPIGYNLMVTPKEIDFVIKKMATLLSSALNEAIHPAFMQ